MTDLQNFFLLSLTLTDVIANILAALVCGLFISIIYRWSYKGLNYSPSFTISLILLTMITAIVIMVIGNNLARAFGMVGAMSIIRFRTAVKDATDIMFIFFSLSIGLACGVKLYAVALFGTLFIGSVFLILTKFNFAQNSRKEFLLQIIAKNDQMHDNYFGQILKSFCKKHKIVNVKTFDKDNNDLMELSYYVDIKNAQKSKEMVRELKNLTGVQSVNLFFDEE